MMYILFIVILCTVAVISADESVMRLQLQAEKTAALNLKIIVVSAMDAKKTVSDLMAIAHVIERDLNFVGHCAVSVEMGQFSKQELTRAHTQDVAFVLFLMMDNFSVKETNQYNHFLVEDNTHFNPYGHLKKYSDHKIRWFLYDVMQKNELSRGFSIQTSIQRAAGHMIANAVHQLLTGRPGFFSTRIVYCKQANTKPTLRPIKHICIADYDGSYEEILVGSAKLNLAPRWNKDFYHPLVFFSESGIENMPLKWVDMKQKIKGQRNDEGLTMQITFSGDGSQAVYCASRGTGRAQLYQWKNGVLKRITNNIGNNIAPSLSDDGAQVVFCSDCPIEKGLNGDVSFITDEFEQKNTQRPQIYKYDLEADRLEAITSGGFCVAPAYHQGKGLIVYSKLIKGILQLMVYDCITKKHTQLTFDEGDKQEASWSICGNYILFAISNNQTSRLALIDIEYPAKYRYITSAHNGHYSYPHWSGLYYCFPSTVM